MLFDTSYFASTTFRKNTRFGIYQEDRMMHMYILGKTGAGKSNLLEILIRQDLRAFRGCCLLDPLGDLAKKIHRVVPKYRRTDVIYLNLTDPKQPYLYNPLKKVSKEKQPLVVGGILSVLAYLFRSSWGDRLEHILRYTLLPLCEQKEASFNDILPMLEDRTFREKVLSQVITKEVLRFWNHEFPHYKASSLIPISNKIGSFLAYPSVRRLLYENAQEISLRKIMDEGKILLVNLSKGEIGEDASSLIGSLLITSLGLAGFSRADIPEKRRTPFFLYVDEYQAFQGAKLPNMLSELRKYKVGLILANQYLEQLQPETREAVLGNTGTLICFRVGGRDAPYLQRELMPKLSAEDVQHLPNYHVYLKLMINGSPSKPFSAKTLTWSQVPKL